MTLRRPSALGTRNDDRLAAFMRGVTVGAFVGAVIAGSTIWRRLRRRAENAPAASRPRPRRAAPPGEGSEPLRP